MPKKLIDGQTPEEILSPEPTTLKRSREPKFIEHGGEDIQILPVPDGVFLRIARDITGALNGLDIVNKFLNPQSSDLITATDLIPVAPVLAEVLFPSASAIIAGSLRLPESEVADNWWPDEKLEALTQILEANNIPNLIKKLTALLGLIPAAPSSTAPGPTVSSPASTATA